ncbi:MAG: glycerophosphodiester phosphodiesterase [Naasia sp.]|nr:glycerophosphodiester phosphodiesterase [Naasia sp.]
MAPVRFLAHRGASAAHPEHTRAAYLQALIDGADGIETDVRITADGHIVCWHDATLDRTTAASGHIADWLLAELRALDLLRGRPIGPELGDAADQLMTLPELLDLMLQAERPLLLAIELKTDTGREHDLVVAVLDELRRAGWDPEAGRIGNVEVSIMSFDLNAAELLADVLPRRDLHLLTEEDHADHLTALAAIDHGRFSAGPDIEWVRLTPGRVADWVAAGTPVRVWTVDDPADLELCLALGVREVTSNRPGQLRAEYEARKAAQTLTGSFSLTATASAAALIAGVLGETRSATPEPVSP